MRGGSFFVPDGVMAGVFGGGWEEKLAQMFDHDKFDMTKAPGLTHTTPREQVEAIVDADMKSQPGPWQEAAWRL